MLRVKEENDQIIIRDIPREQIIKSSVFIVILFLVTYFIASSYGIQVYGMLWMIVYFIYQLKDLNIKTIRLNKKTGTISIEDRNLIRTTFAVYTFGKLAGQIEFEEIENAKGKKQYQLTMPLVTGEKVELSGLLESKPVEHIDIKNAMNDFIKNSAKQIP